MSTNSNPYLQDVPRQPWMTDNDYAWAQQEELARVNSLRRLEYDVSTGEWALIAVKAQHPLNPDGTPGPEYIARLNAALEFANDLLDRMVSFTFMVFGGIHAGHETVTLAEAGATWLQHNGIDPEDIIVRPDVYSGNDEDDLAAQEFAQNLKYSELHVFMSAGQFDRPRFYFISTGWQPFLHPIIYLDGRPNHSSLCEFAGTYASSARSLVAGGLEKIQEATEEVRRRHAAELTAFKAEQAKQDNHPDQP